MEQAGWMLELEERFSSGQSLSRVWLFVTPQTAACQTSLSVTNSQSLLKLKSVEPVMTSTNAEHTSIYTECYKVAVSNRIVLWNGGLGKNVHSFIFRIFFRMLGQEWTIRYEGKALKAKLYS